MYENDLAMNEQGEFREFKKIPANAIRNFVFTLNNWTEEEYEHILNYPCRYVIIGKEIGGKNGTPHLQGYMELLKSGKRLGGIKKDINERMWIGERRGSARQAADYCKKDAEWDERGEISNQGNRSDLSELAQRIKEGEKVNDIILEDEVAIHYYGRTLDRLEDVINNKKWRTWVTTGTWIYGKTATGKSHEAFKDYHPDTHYSLNLNDGGWWDGYKGQETVIINEFRGQIPFGELLDLIDKYPKTVKRRNRCPAQFLSKHIIITSSMHPAEVYKNLAKDDKIDQLLDRIEIVEKTVAWRR